MNTVKQGSVLCLGDERWQVEELDWTPPHQRLIVRMVNDEGAELALTPHELRTNGARNG